MIFNTKKPHVLEIDGLTVTCHQPDAVEQAEMMDTLMDDTVKGAKKLPKTALKFFEIAVDDITGVQDEDGNSVPFEKTEAYVRGFPLTTLRAIVDAVQEVMYTPVELKKK